MHLSHQRPKNYLLSISRMVVVQYYVMSGVVRKKGSGLITRLVVGFDEKRGKFKIHGTNITWHHAVPLQESCLADEVLKYVDSIVDLYV